MAAKRPPIKISHPGGLTAAVGGKPSSNPGKVRKLETSGTPLQRKQASLYENVFKPANAKRKGSSSKPPARTSHKTTVPQPRGLKSTIPASRRGRQTTLPSPLDDNDADDVPMPPTPGSAGFGPPMGPGGGGSIPFGPGGSGGPPVINRKPPMRRRLP